MMKSPSFRHLTAAAILFATTHISHGASAFWSFQTDADGSVGSHSLDPTINNGFAAVTPVATFLGDGNGATVANTGGQLSYTYGLTDYTGNSTNNVSGGSSRAIGWQAASTSTLAESGFSFGLNTTGLTDLSLSFSVRSVSSSTSTVGPAPTQFARIEYSLDNGGTWVNTNLASTFIWTASNTFNARSPVLSFSGLTAIENQENVQLRFVLGDTKIGSGTISFRIDNLEVNAIPEPSILASSAAGLLLLARRRRR